MRIFKYETEDEAQEIIARETATPGVRLVEIANITEGNFLAFDDSPTVAPTTPIEAQLEELRQQNFILMDALATIYENQLLMGGV